MLILVEGVDKSGKTTICMSLVSECMRLGIECEMVHSGVPGDNPYEEYKDIVLRSREGLIICDRLHLGELVYGPLYRGGSKISMLQCFHLEMLMQPAVLVMPWAKKEDLEERWDGDYALKKDLVKIRDAFFALPTRLMRSTSPLLDLERPTWAIGQGEYAFCSDVDDYFDLDGYCEYLMKVFRGIKVNFRFTSDKSPKLQDDLFGCTLCLCTSVEIEKKVSEMGIPTSLIPRSCGSVGDMRRVVLCAIAA